MSHSKSDEIAQYRRFIRIHGKLYSKSFVRKTDADRWYLERKREKQLTESGVTQELSEMTVMEFAREWMIQRKAQGKAESSWLTDERRLRLHVLPEMGERVFHRISRKEWEDFLNSLLTRKKLDPSTRNRVHALVSKMYRDALRQDLVLINPMTAIPKLRESQDRWDYWHALDECANYLEAARKEEPAFRMFASLALNTGARVGELLAVRNQDVQRERRRIHIWRTYEQETHRMVERTKGRGDRWLGINPALYQTLVEYQAQTKLSKPTDLLIHRGDGRPFEEWVIRLRHRRTCERAGVKLIRVHDLRHTYGSHYVMMSGGSLADLQTLLGHSSSEMTRKYAHLTPGHLESKSAVVSFSAGSSGNDPRTFPDGAVSEPKLKLVSSAHEN